MLTLPGFHGRRSTPRHGGRLWGDVDDQLAVSELRSCPRRRDRAASSGPTGAGYEVLEASNGYLGLAVYREQSADLIITDILMPAMSGLELMLALTRSFLNVKVIVMTGDLRSEGTLDTAKLLGACQTFQKPIDMDELLRVVRYDLAH